MSDKDLYLKAEKEFNSDSKNEALWSKSLTLNSGDEKKAKYTYITLRVEELSNTKTQQPRNIIKNSNPLKEGYDSSNTNIFMKILFTAIAIPVVIIIVWLLFGETDFSVNFAVGAVAAAVAGIWFSPPFKNNAQKQKTKKNIAKKKIYTSGELTFIGLIVVFLLIVLVDILNRMV